MENTNIIFFEEYKKLENICNQMYGGNSGITSYIKDMESTTKSIRLHIREWDNTLHYLKRIRHMRNQLAHEVTYDSELSTQKDIDWVRDFYDKILHTRDPLALLNRIEEHPKNKTKKVQDSHTKQTNQSSQTMLETKVKRISDLIKTVLTVVLFIAFLILLGWFVAKLCTQL